MKYIKNFQVVLLLLFTISQEIAWSQNSAPTVGPSQPGMVLKGLVLLDGDTLPNWYLQEVEVLERYSSSAMSAKVANLRYNVYKVYPYAVEAARIINELDVELKKADKRKERKKYIKVVEEQLNVKFKDRLKNLSTTQGSILVKLVNRQSGRDVYSIIKELKGGLSARVSQTAFYFFDNNLKTQYDPFGADKAIEQIVQEIESKAYYNYQIQNTPIIKMSESKK